jgi:hypothetical protein
MKGFAYASCSEAASSFSTSPVKLGGNITKAIR